MTAAAQPQTFMQPSAPAVLERLAIAEKRITELESKLNDTRAEFNTRLCNLEDTLGTANPAQPAASKPGV